LYEICKLLSPSVKRVLPKGSLVENFASRWPMLTINSINGEPQWLRNCWYIQGRSESILSNFISAKKFKDKLLSLNYPKPKPTDKN
jgi:hypothetical protein